MFYSMYVNNTTITQSYTMGEGRGKTIFQCGGGCESLKGWSSWEVEAFLDITN